MARELPANPNITHLRRQAKDLKKAIAAGDRQAIERARSARPGLADSDIEGFTLRDAQLTIAREYGFDGWHDLNVAVGERMVEERDLHRWFGVQLNNGVWARLDAADVGPDSPLEERERLLYSAYASAYHWMNAGTFANRARGEHLIARTATAVGLPDLAMQHARRCLELCEQNPVEVEDWDLAFAHEALARAVAARGDRTLARDLRAKAQALGEAIAGDGDRAAFLEELEKGPWFGI